MISILRLGERVARTKATVAKQLPTMTTGRQPNLLVIADTMGPEKVNKRRKSLE